MVERFRAPEQLGSLVSGWQVIYVDEAVENSGSGSSDAPFQTLAEALEAAEEAPSVLVLAPGEYLGPVQVRASLAIIGAGVGATTITTADDVAVQADDLADDRLILGWLSLRGAEGISVSNLRDVYGFHLSIQAQDALALHARGEYGAFVSTEFSGAEATALKRPLVLIEGSGLALFKTPVSGHAGYGVQAKFMNTEPSAVVKAPFVLSRTLSILRTWS